MAINLVYSDVCINLNIGDMSRSALKEIEDNPKIINSTTYPIKLLIRANFNLPFKAANPNLLKTLKISNGCKISLKTLIKQVDTKIKPSIIRPHQTDWQ